MSYQTYEGSVQKHCWEFEGGNTMEYFSTKTYTHAQGLSCAFRQWRADHSHCQFIHGYAIEVSLTFGADTLDDRNWVADFGGFKSIKAWLEDTFDHKLLVAHDDPHKDDLVELFALGLAEVRIVPNTGCEAFAELIGERVNKFLVDQGIGGRVRLIKVEVREHAGNSAGVNYDGRK